VGGIWTAEGASDRDWRGLEGCSVKSVMFCTVTVIRQVDGACGTNGGEDKCVQTFGGET